MRQSIALLCTLLFVADVVIADPAAAYREVDLRDAAALRRLAQVNPAHYATIQRILAGLAEHPERAESGWLQASFDARDVELSRLVLKTSHPPRQLLRFTLGDTRYALHVVRTDLDATFQDAGLSPTDTSSDPRLAP